MHTHARTRAHTTNDQKIDLLLIKLGYAYVSVRTNDELIIVLSTITFCN